MQLKDIYTLINKNKALNVINMQFNNYIVYTEQNLFITDRQLEYDQLKDFTGTYDQFISYLTSRYDSIQTDLSFDNWKVTQFDYDQDIIDGYTTTFNNLTDSSTLVFDDWVKTQDYNWLKEDHTFTDYLNFDSTAKFDETTIDYSKYVDTAKDVRKQLLKKEHSTALTQGAICGTAKIKLDCDEISVNNFNLYMTQRNLEEDTTSDVTICDYDNVTRQITYADFLVMCKDLGTYYNGLYSRKWTARTAVNSATTVRDIFQIYF